MERERRKKEGKRKGRTEGRKRIKLQNDGESLPAVGLQVFFVFSLIVSIYVWVYMDILSIPEFNFLYRINYISQRI